MEDFYAKYKMQLLPMIHQALCTKAGKTEWSELYTPAENHLRMELLKVMKVDLIKKKRDELGGKPADELLTKDNLERWLDAGETYNSISFNYTGSAPDKISRIAKEYGLKSKGKEAYAANALPTDADLIAYVNTNTTAAILNDIAAVIRYEKRTRQEPTPAPATKPVNYETLAELIKEHTTYKSIADALGADEGTIRDLCEVYGLSVKDDVKRKKRFIYSK